MTFEKAQELFYNNEKIQKQFDFWEIDRAIAIINTFIDDIEEIVKDHETLIENDCDLIALTEYEGGEPVDYTKSDKELEDWLNEDEEHSWFPVEDDEDCEEDYDEEDC